MDAASEGLRPAFLRMGRPLRCPCGCGCPVGNVLAPRRPRSVRPRRKVGRVTRLGRVLLHGQGVGSAYLYGTPGAPGATGGLGHLNAFFLLTDRPEVYNFPVAPTRASSRVAPSLVSGLMAVAALATAASFILSRRGRRP